MRISVVANFPLHFLPGFEGEPPSGHYATWLPQLSAQFEKAAGFEFHWVTVSKRLVSEQPIRWRGQTFHFLHNPQRMRMLRGYGRDCRLICERLDAIQPDLVHAWGSEDCYGLAGARCGRPWLLSMQGLLQEYVRRVPMHPLVRLQAWYEEGILRRAREITVESHWGEEMLRRWAPRARIRLVEYGVQPAFFEQKWEPDPVKPYAIFVGTPEARKGIREAVRAFAEPSLAGAELHVAGDGDSALVRELKAMATGNVRWLGRLTPAQTAQALARAWCLVLPTFADTSPNVVKEARVIGLPVVTTPEGGQSDYIVDGVNGYLVAPGDSSTLAQRLASLLGDLDRCRAMGSARQSEQREFLRPEHTAARFLAIYRELIGNPLAPAAETLNRL